MTIVKKVRKILVDENMPYAQELFRRTGDVLAVPCRALSSSKLNDIDGLMIRSVTKVNTQLLNGTSVKFVGTATAGTDHIDKDYLEQRGIAFSAAPGCNAIAVVEYVFSALLLLAERDGFQLTDRTVGIVGVGNVGRQLQTRLEALGIRTLLCDPPQADHGNTRNFQSLAELVKHADILTFHVPLLSHGQYQTLHMVDEALMLALKPNTILINTCRGSVVDNAALFSVLNRRNDLSVVLDVWEHEPELSLPLIDKVDIATAHIAGSTLEGKLRGTTKIFESWTHFIGQPQSIGLDIFLPTPQFFCIKLYGTLDQETLKRLVHLVYDVRRDDALLRHVADVTGEFDRLRKNYYERREWSSLLVQCNNADVAALLNQIGFTAVHQTS